MSGHSKWAKTHRQKAVTDIKRGAVFTKLGNLITVASRQGGGDASSNFKLRLAIEKARAANLPKDKIEKAIKRGTGENSEGAKLEEIIYEIFGPQGSAFIVEAITDNKNRTISEIKIALNKNGGRLAGPNSVLWLFKKSGLIEIKTEWLKDKKSDELELGLIDAGAQNIVKDKDFWEIYTLPDELQTTQQAIKNLNIDINGSGLVYLAKNELKIKETETQEKIEKLNKALAEIDEVNNVYTNANS